MKRYLKDFEFSVDFIEECIIECFSNGKWTRNDVARFIAHFAQIWLYQNKQIRKSYTATVKLVKKQIKVDKTKLFVVIRYIAEELYQELEEKRIKLAPISYSNRVDGSSGKVRRIGVSSMKQQCYDYIVTNACMKMFLAKIGHYQCASLRDKGQLFGKNSIETWIRTNSQKCKWIFKADVKHFYNSVNHDMLKNLLKRDIKNDTILYLLYYLIDTYELGLCIGSYLCQYLANYVMSYAYHYVSEMIYTERRGKKINLVNHVLFYMDDIILFSSSKKNLKRATQLFESYLNNKLLLELKPTYQLFKLDSRPIDMMGYKIYTYKTTVRKTIFKRANKMFRRIKRNNYKFNLKTAYQVVSYWGYFKHSFSKKYIDKMKIKDIVQKSKEMISYAAKSGVSRETT